MNVMLRCTICSEDKLAGQVWFLVAESHREDTVAVLEWREDVARRTGVFPVCSPAHVRELVVHWMATGSLDYPFAAVSLSAGRRRRRLASMLHGVETPDRKGIRQIGEVAVDRESVWRTLQNDPDSLQTILDELVNVLQWETQATGARVESSGAMWGGFPRGT